MCTDPVRREYGAYKELNQRPAWLVVEREERGKS